MINKTIASRYKIIERVGIGGMAEVYKAQDEVLGRIDAIKVLLPQYASDQTFAARFRQEAQAAANLSSPYIVNIYDWGSEGETYYIVMEFVKGVDLKTAIANRGAIDQRKVAQIGVQICSGLAVAHENDVIHRDIKPQNIMIQPDGNIKIMDFGVARAGNSTMTQTGSVLGTANYVSPEQAQGKTPTAASDIYSLGILMYEAVTGRLPFEGPDAISVALKQVNELPVPPSTYNPSIDPSFEAIILKALEKDPLNRFTSADEMKATLNSYLNGTPIDLGLSAGVTRVISDDANTTQVISDDASKTSVMPAGYGSNKGVIREKSQKKKSKKPLIIAICVIAVLAIAGVAIWGIFFSGNNGVEVPNVLGQEQSVAEQTLQDAGFEVTVKQDYSDSVDAGLVMSQSPEGDTLAASGSTVEITISQGSRPAETVTVPDLTNMTVDEATEVLARYNLSIASGNPVYDDDVEVGLIAQQSPTSGSTVEVGSTVTIYTSLGAEGVTIPDVRGDDVETARATLQNAGLNVVIQEQASSQAEGTVIAVSPTVGNSVSKGTTVTITVSSGPATVTVPNVVGDSLSSAVSTLENLGLVVNVSPSTATSGTVTSTSPSSGSSVAAGSTITVYVE